MATSGTETGTSGTDTIIGDEADNVILGGAGDDILDGGAGNDRVEGGKGDDTLIYDWTEDPSDDRKFDLYNGGSGYDTLVVRLSADQWADTFIQSELIALFDALAGYETSGQHFPATFLDGIDLKVLNIEALRVVVDGTVVLEMQDGRTTIDLGSSTASLDLDYSDSGDVSVATGTGNDTITTGAGADVVDAGDGDNTLSTGEGDDLVTAGSGNDLIDSGTGDDTVTIGDGDDVARLGDGDDTAIAGAAGGDDLIDGNDGTDTVAYPSLGAGEGVRIDLAASDLSADPTVATLLTDNGYAADTPVGIATGIGHDGLGTDVLISIENATGGNGDDEIFGSDSANTLDGSAGNDLIAGRGGDDILIGGLGDDVFVIGAGDGNDTIADFTIGEDLLELEGGEQIASLAEAGGDTVVTLAGGGQVTLTGVTGVTGVSQLLGLTITSDGGGDTAALAVAENGTLVTQVVADDPEGDAVEYSIVGGADAALFEINAATGVLTFLSAPDFEAPADTGTDNSYEVTVQAFDAVSGQTDTQALAVEVTPVADAPTLVLEPGDGFGEPTPVPSGTDVQVTTNSYFVQAGATVTALADGGFVVTWHSSGSAAVNREDIFLQRFDANGAPVGGETLVNTTTKAVQEDTTITALADGGWLVAWTSDPDDGAGSNIFAQRFDASGAPDGGEFQITADGVNFQRASDLLALADGGWITVWEAANKSGVGLGIFAQRFDADGTAAGGPVQVNTHTGSDKVDPELTALADGGWLVTWSSDLQDGDSFGIFAQRFGADGSPVDGEVQVNTTTADFQFRPAAVGLPDGGWLVTWTSRVGDGSGNGIFAQRYAADGSPLGGEVLVNTTTDGSQFSGTPVLLEDGGWLITWTSNPGDGSSSGLFAQRFDADGQAVGDEYQVNSRTLGPQSSTTNNNVAVLQDGRVVTIYEDGALYDLFHVVADIPAGAAGEEDAPLALGLSAALTDADGSETLTLVMSGYPVGASFSHGIADGATWVIETAESLDLSTLTMTPPADWNGTFTLEVTATATETVNGDTAEIVVSADYTIAPVNDAPVALDDTLTMTEYDGTLMFELFANDTDLEGDALYLAEVNGVEIPFGKGTKSLDTAHGSGSVMPTGTLYYTPDPGFLGTDSFTYAITDGEGVSELATVTISVNPVADAPLLALRSEGDLGPLPVSGDIGTTAPGFTGREPVVTALDDGGYLIVFTSADGDRNRALDVVTQRYDATGTLVDGPTVVHSFTDGVQRDPAVAVLADGGWVVSWTGEGPTPDSWGIYCMRFAADGTPVGTETRLNLATIVTNEESEVAALNDGGWVVTWEAQGADGDQSGIVSQRFAADGTATGGETLVNSTTLYSQEASDVTALSDGGWLVVWQSPLQDGDGSGIFAQRYASDGSRVGGETQTNTTANNQYDPSVDLLDDGGWVVTWTSNGQDGSGGGIYGQRFDAAGNLVDGEFQVNTTTDNDQAKSTVTALDDGGWLVTWTSYFPEINPGAWKILTQRFDAAGNAVGSEIQINTNLDFPYPEGDATAQLADGGLVTVFGHPGGRRDVYHVLSDLPDGIDGVANEPLTLQLTAALTDTDGSETLTLLLTGQPGGATFNFGSQVGDDWVIENAQTFDLSTLEMTLPTDWDGVFTLEVTATATETIGGDTAETTASADYTILPVDEFLLV